MGAQEIRQIAGIAARAEGRDRKVAEDILGQHGQERIEAPRRQTVADHYAVDLPCVEAARRLVDAECAHDTDTLANRDAEHRINRPAADHEHGCVIERVAFGKLGHDVALGLECAGVRPSTVACSARTRSAAATRATSCSAGASVEIGSALGSGGAVSTFTVRSPAGRFRSSRSAPPARPRPQGRARARQHNGGRFDQVERGRRTPSGLDGRERPGARESLNECSGRLLGNNNNRTPNRAHSRGMPGRYRNAVNGSSMRAAVRRPASGGVRGRRRLRAGWLRRRRAPRARRRGRLELPVRRWTAYLHGRAASCCAFGAGGEFPQLAEHEAIAADADDARRRAGDHKVLASRSLAWRLVSGMARRIDFEVRRAERSGSPAERRGVAPSSRAPPACRLRRVQAPVNRRGAGQAARTVRRPEGMLAGRPSGLWRMPSSATSPKAGMSTNAALPCRHGGLVARRLALARAPAPAAAPDDRAGWLR